MRAAVGRARESIVFRSEVQGRWCPITSHFLSDDGILGFQHYTSYMPTPVRCPLDWSEHPVATRTTEIATALSDDPSAARPGTLVPNSTDES